MNSSPHFLDFLGIEPLGFIDENYVIQLKIQNHHLNIGGIVHGGVISSLLDTALSRSYFKTLPEGGLPAATLELKVNFLSSCKFGSLKAYGRITHQTKRTALVEGHVEDDTGKLLAKASATMMIFSERKVRT